MLAFTFPGQGSQYVGMLRDLACQFPEVLGALAAADGESDPVRLADVIYPPASFDPAAGKGHEAALRATDAAQHAMEAIRAAGPKREAVRGALQQRRKGVAARLLEGEWRRTPVTIRSWELDTSERPSSPSTSNALQDKHGSVGERHGAQSRCSVEDRELMR